VSCRQAHIRADATVPETWFFESWKDLLRVLTLGVCAYFALIVLLRVAGKRTLTKMNAFDLTPRPSSSSG
jgi:hypothetical protein